ncbi:hypothetical protein PYCCODRAFT_980776 [Trametes coccinea BRFM310]|uniref:Uncharacterized protein n=1 Tax=Trametes coccinea (strain BRFM310) TaxID=1353009 RepID=A0A1Y2IDT5_TRAC3|nr:hypothetical protein PYCCODRAFT_980776 [Trametes coccinea BRFM310]
MGIADMSAGRKVHPLKKRKLAPSVSATMPAQPASLIPATPGIVGTPICNSCHRAFAGSKRNQLVQCARCHEPTCMICSRTCNGCPPSEPPTPALTTSPSSVPDTPLMSPRRSSVALGLDLRNLQDHAPVQTLAGRRRKVRELDQDEDRTEGRRRGRSDEEAEEEGAEEVLPGCGRTVCQKCCFETPARCAIVFVA